VTVTTIDADYVSLGGGAGPGTGLKTGGLGWTGLAPQGQDVFLMGVMFLDETGDVKRGL